MLSFAFFLLPATLYLGIAAQAAGLYFLGLIIPFMLIGSPLHDSTRFPWRKVGYYLLGIYFIFVLSNLVNGFRFYQADMILPEGFRFWKILSSRLSSSVFIVSMFFIVSFFFNRRRRQSTSPIEFYDRGSVIASIVILTYAIIQHTTGFDYRSVGNTLAPEHKMASGLYRVFGFYGHPLTLGSVALIHFSFYLTRFFELFSTQTTITDGLNNKIKQQKISFLFIVMSNITLIYMTGSRGALLSALIITLLVAVYFSKNLDLKKVLGIGIIFSIVAALAWYIFSSRTEGSVLTADRFKFWRVHWALFLDQPILGQGHAWLDGFVRTEFYDKLGYTDLRDKFNAHNVYLETLACVGLVGISFISYCLIHLKKLFSHRPLKVALGFALLANVFHGVTQNVFFDASVNIVYLALIVLIYWDQLMSEK